MKLVHLKKLSGLFFTFFFLSCYSMPIDIESSKSWRMSEESEPKQTIKLIGVTVDSGGGWGSLEKEVTAIAPLYFWTKGFLTVEPGDYADYAAEINLREREFAVGWSTKKSLAMEVHIWKCGNGISMRENVTGKMPVAAGRVVLTGNKSFSSSKVTEKMLSKAISKTLRQLPQYRQGTSLSKR